MTIFVNARFRRQPLTGVQRYAIEICNRLAGSVEELTPPERYGSGVPGHIWEQVALPLQARRKVLWSPCNVGPLAARTHVVTVHDMAFSDCPEGFSKSFAALYQYLIPRLVRRAARVLTVSEFSKSRIVDITDVSPDKVEVVPNGVSDSLLSTVVTSRQTSESAESQPHRPFVLTVGSMNPRKNLSGLFEAWRLISQTREFADVDLCVVGGASPGIFPEMAMQNAVGTVRFLGRVDDRRLAELYRDAICCVNPSFYEGFGLPIVEAFAAGCPVVCSDRTAFPEVGGDAVDYFQPDDPRSIADVLAEVVRRYRDSDARLRQSVIVKERAKSFNWDHSAEQVRGILEAVAKERGILR